MKTLDQKTADLIRKELESIPEKYHKNFNSNHEGYAVLLEEVRELEGVVFFGENELNKNIPSKTEEMMKIELGREKINVFSHMDLAHKMRLREEAIQVAAMAVRIIQELTV